jgi:hypothetical protein
LSEREPQPLTVSPQADGARTVLGNTGPSRSESAVSECLRCGYRLAGLVIEVEGEYLRRCPSCDGYNWTPEPVRIAELRDR